MFEWCKHKSLIKMSIFPTP